MDGPRAPEASAAVPRVENPLQDACAAITDSMKDIKGDDVEQKKPSNRKRKKVEKAALHKAKRDANRLRVWEIKHLLPKSPKMVEEVANKKEFEKDPFVISTDRQVFELGRTDIAGRYFRFDDILAPMLATLESSTTELVKYVDPHAGNKGTRNDTDSLHFGHWRRYAKPVRLTKDTVRGGTHAKKWLQQNRPLFKFLADTFERTFPTVYKTYRNAVERLIAKGLLTEDFFFAWTTCAINVVSCLDSHTDENDSRNGFCWIVPFGKFTGGRLRLDHANVEFEMVEGAVVALRSQSIWHSVTKYEGTRRSIVLFIDELMMMMGNQ